MKFRVTAQGILGSTFVYVTEGPDDASDMAVLQEVYATHGRALRSGDEDEPLSPFNDVERITP